MDIAKLPGFNAEASVYRAARVYYAGGSDAKALVRAAYNVMVPGFAAEY